MTSKLKGKSKILLPVYMRPLKILKPKLDLMISLSTPKTVPVFVESGQMGSAASIAEI